MTRVRFTTLLIAIVLLAAHAMMRPSYAQDYQYYREEFRLHVRSGLARDLEWCDLEEVLLHTAVYAGVPAANTGFRVAAEEREALTRA